MSLCLFKRGDRVGDIRSETLLRHVHFQSKSWAFMVGDMLGETWNTGTRICSWRMVATCCEGASIGWLRLSRPKECMWRLKPVWNQHFSFCNFFHMNMQYRLMQYITTVHFCITTGSIALQTHTVGRGMHHVYTTQSCRLSMCHCLVTSQATVFYLASNASRVKYAT